MDYNRIEILLQKYLEGTSSLSEEKELNIFFTENEHIPEKLLFAKDLFCHFNEVKTHTYTKKFETKAQINKNKFYILVGIAASLLLGLFLLSPTMNSDNKVIYAYIDGKAITDISIAEEYTKHILYSASKNLDNGTKSLNIAGKYANPITLINN